MQKTSGWKKGLVWLLALVLCVGLIPIMAAAADGVSYIDASGHEASQDGVTEVSSETVEWTDGWYVVNGTVTIGQRVTVNGGIRVMDSNSLTIYAQSTGDSMGSLTAQNVGYYNAGIGSNKAAVQALLPFVAVRLIARAVSMERGLAAVKTVVQARSISIAA